MKIPEKFIPLGPDMAFEMPDGEFLPMWVWDIDSCTAIGRVKAFDGMRAITYGLNWSYCMPLEGHPIPESALKKNKKPRRMTNREVAELLGRWHWGECSVGSSIYSHYAYTPLNTDKEFRDSIRAWGSDEWVEPTIDILEKCRNAR